MQFICASFFYQVQHIIFDLSMRLECWLRRAFWVAVALKTSNNVYLGIPILLFFNVPSKSSCNMIFLWIESFGVFLLYYSMNVYVLYDCLYQVTTKAKFRGKGQNRLKGSFKVWKEDYHLTSFQTLKWPQKNVIASRFVFVSARSDKMQQQSKVITRSWRRRSYIHTWGQLHF